MPAILDGESDLLPRQGSGVRNVRTSNCRGGVIDDGSHRTPDDV